MMCRLIKLTSWSVIGFVMLQGTSSVAQLAKTKPPVPVAPSKTVVIADEPLAVDPAAGLPEALSAKATAKFVESSLQDVAQWVQEQTGFPVVLERRSLDSAGILASEPVTDHLDEEALYLILDRLQILGVQWRLVEGVLYLNAEEAPVVYTQQYNVGDLFDAGYEPDALQQTMQACVSAESWEDLGGPGGAVMLGDVMFVRQTGLVHRKVSGLLTALRKHGRQTMIFAPPQHQVLREALSRVISVRFKEFPLAVVTEQLSNLSGADIRLDARALQAEGLRARMPVTLEIAEQPLRLVLDLLTQDLDLAWQLKDGALWITTEEAVDLVTAVYDVRDLCRDQGEALALQEAIESQTSPESWESYGGLGVIEFPLPGAMVLCQSARLHESVLQLLENYRKALLASKPRGVLDQNPEETHYYKMPTNVAKDLLGALSELVAPETWKTEANPEAVGTIRLLESWGQPLVSRPSGKGKESLSQPIVSHSVMIIRQKKSVHEEILQLLQMIEHGDSGSIGMGAGGMMGGGGMFGGGFFNIAPHRD